MLSTRARAALNSPMRADLDLFERAMDNAYHLEDNPDGAIPLCIAENLLSWPALRDKFQRIVATRTTPDWVAGYAPTLGAPEFREALAGFLSKHLGGNALNPETLAIAGGATAVIEQTAFLLGNPGDVAVIPAPTYAVYAKDVGNRADMEVHYLHLPPHPESPCRYQLTTSDLDAALAELGNRFRMLILTQPNNPTGQVFTEDNIYACLNWCEEHRVHLVVNELYALSLIDQSHPDLIDEYPGREWFVSCLPLLEARGSDYFHWWYSFSKDFGISGFRLGALYTKNERLIKAWANNCAPSIAGNYAQWLLTELLNDGDWAINHIRNIPLTESYTTVIRSLRSRNIEYIPAVGSLFVWFNLAPYLNEPSHEAQEDLWTEIFEQTGVLLTAPGGMGTPEPGWFRLVYSGVDRSTLTVAMNRLLGFLDGVKRNNQ